ncbi:MAG: hypothetical protein JWN95_3216 [Frankiales bacterium]|nr:hypothetical protein [Frankiales bacterium]
MRKSTKFLAAVAFAGLAAAGGSAFTGSGVTNNAGASQFVGGTVSQSVTGATLSSLEYSYADASNTAIHSALLTFADADSDGKAVGIVFTGGNAAAFTCTAIEAVGHTSTCTPVAADETAVTSAAITVS